jgi:hypothetical protein
MSACLHLLDASYYTPLLKQMEAYVASMQRMIDKEGVHRLRGVGAIGISVGTSGVAT